MAFLPPSLHTQWSQYRKTIPPPGDLPSLATLASVSFDEYLAVHKLIITKRLAALCLSFLVEMHPLTPMHQPGFAKPLILQMSGVTMQGHRV